MPESVIQLIMVISSQY
uniref:Uncharacterized protein n=1 Tax=Arundo donax TaxID=35708 RepID=A0A0A8YHY4_ARUDO